MKTYALDLWERAKDALRVARHTLAVSPDASASRAYYAAFYGVSALLALRGQTFTKHSAVEAAVHRDLVRQGDWSKRLGSDYSALVRLRSVSDYGVSEHVSQEAAQEAIEMAGRILKAVSEEGPEVLTGYE